MDQIINSFKVKKSLNDLVWDQIDDESIEEIKLNSEIRKNLLDIAQAFVESFKLDDVDVDDILFLGSLAAFNWSKYSDIDLHILIDKSSIEGSPKMVDEFFDAKKTIFNDNHEITIKGFQVEVYVQDIKEENEANGIYSVLYNKWVKIPQPEENEKVDKQSIIRKVKEFNKNFKTVKSMEDGDKKLTKLTNLQDKIKKYRKSGLEKNGEMSTENLVFKYLRRSGYMEELINLKIEVMDKILTLNEGVNFK